ncbi:MAG: MFS transporter [Alphaproteobacteria bacterium]|nr:MFS transporter [Alphaproteobacteria bacterium]MBV9540264.1 MFS transporter [Alphaproteobacteria bacterium]MBV9903159.1 MFS transporter [Alphaproteobacteria bacterium]
MQKQLWAIGAILCATALYIAGNGLIGVLIPVRAHMAGFSNLTLGIIGSLYFAGFVGGCYAGPRLLARVGHSRTFGIGAGISAATILIQAMFVTEPVWILARGAFGVAAACIYMVIESWLNDRATNETRGRIFSAYLTVNFSAIIAGQMLFGTARPSSFALFSTAAICYALSLIPMGLTRLPQPLAATVPVLRPLRLYGISPVGVMGCIAVGFANSAMWTLAPVFAQTHGLGKGWIAVFMSVFTFGGAIIQLPLGRISDRMDRRFIIAFVCVAAAALGVTLATFGAAHRWYILPLIAFYGMMALPLYGLSVAHANDRMKREEFVEASATLLLTNSLSSVLGPTLAALVIGRFGTASLFFYTAAIHVTMAAFTVVRIAMSAAPPAELKDRFEALPQQGTPAEAELDPRAEEKAA